MYICLDECRIICVTVIDIYGDVWGDTTHVSPYVCVCVDCAAVNPQVPVVSKCWYVQRLVVHVPPTFQVHTIPTRTVKVVVGDCCYYYYHYLHWYYYYY